MDKTLGKTLSDGIMLLQLELDRLRAMNRHTVDATKRGDR